MTKTAIRPFDADGTIADYENEFARMPLDELPSGLVMPDNSIVTVRARAFPDGATITPQTASATKGYTLGLTKKQILECRRCTLRAAYIGYKNAPAVHYTEGSLRWTGIDDGLHSGLGQFPSYADCSSYVTWCHWDGTHWLRLGDYVNGQSWRAGYTGTMVQHGIALGGPGDLLSSDAVFYYNSSSLPGHTAIYVGNGRVISHGTEAGPSLIPYNLASPIVGYRGYLR